MKNLSFKERFLLILCGLALFVAIAYIFVIMPMDKKIDARKLELEDCRAKDIEFKQIKESNDRLSIEIDKINAEIETIEKSLLANIDVDVLENYVIDVFKSGNSPYLSNITSSDIATDDIILPGGQVANEKLVQKRISVEYVTTDGGYAVPEADMDKSWVGITENGTPGYNEEAITAAIAQMGYYPDDRDLIYANFIAACKKISEVKSSCVKVHNITVEDSTYGFMYLRAEIDVYGANLGGSRGYDPVQDPNQVKFTWAGATGVNCEGGMIGAPILNTNDKNGFFGIVISNDKLKDFVNRPYASYFSTAIISEVAKADLPIYDKDGKASAASDAYMPKFDDMAGGTPTDAPEDVVETPAD